IALERDLTGRVETLLRVLPILGIRQALRPESAPAKPGLVPATNDPARDLVMTPPDLAARIIAHFADRMSGHVLDPALGTGALHDQFPDHVERSWCELALGRDFLACSDPVDWIMTNPPWSKLREFTRHAMTISENVVWLAPLTNLTTKARLRDLDQQDYGIAELVLIDTPKGWPQSGFQLVAAHIARGHTGGWMMSRLSDQDV
uniref:hypothetical protein n=1 Tax=Thioclava sp. TaxID=1933450 RepID=UPI003AA81F31